ncbi:aminotransferase class V-fold PLP-dependent enzyme [Kutzneria sp. CA-103260]|uniref:aminotransferase class V-fold PLP-dependent enzyme n=1 Tax=Kutzneria sp. CA-103260 TaxID=2802641 RepID=UPI001BEF67E9|nr:aminotransferase class V-fold PLP-dependent enzyme [Kutzneria sp. CA-103260]QUQ72494.1 cysteine desulfurase [Kutzneria sp. CA-103260]
MTLVHENVVPLVAGADLPVPLVTGGTVPYANLDHAASAPCLAPVRAGVDQLLPWYASVHRGAGFASQVCTRAYERARDTVRDFVGATPGSTVVFTRNTTDALNLLARSLPSGTTVFRFDSDHHAALLPWGRHTVRRLPLPVTPDEAVRQLRAGLASCPPGPRLVVLTGASNVTGELWPVAELAAVAADHGARTVLDAAQLAPHGPVRAVELGVDWVALSGHKLYAPFGAGALIGAPDWLADAEPYLFGGGAVSRVDGSCAGPEATWLAPPERHEAGSPNVVGAHALALACEAITACGWSAIRSHEQPLTDDLRAGLAGIPGVRPLSMWDSDHPRVGVVSFAVDGIEPGLLAAALSAEHGIGVRDGAFCAHMGTRTLLAAAGADADGAVRASVGLGSRAEHVERLVAAVARLVRSGPRWDYRKVDGRWTPSPDPRRHPDLRAGDPDVG